MEGLVSRVSAQPTGWWGEVASGTRAQLPEAEGVCPAFPGVERQNQFSVQESCIFETTAAPDSLKTKLIRHFVFVPGQPWYAGLHSDQGH